ncbi:Hypothetical predicted protein [Lecanosticta acicola]|uniref:Uncharacterized protein n=1 Tax=Lecanosticta acicola TaxID=111012 RepID=A0AAI8Z0R2_9PEZI|nr:Hypothetical predicted protein [Lecanosticta acicola]
MPSIEESKRQVKASLRDAHQDIDHDAILASLQDEIDRHNEREDDDDDGKSGKRRCKHTFSERDDRERERSVKFRFKSGTSDPRDRKRRKHRRRERSEHPDEPEAAHPFPREPTNSDQSGQFDANAAFRDSLFDALADDEGAAYWESVYSQPIHVYPRPTKETAQGELEQMNDEEYAAYVQAKMWEKQHPEIVRDRERQKKQRKEEEEERTRRREEFVRRKQRAAWERAQQDGARKFAGVDGDDYEYEFDFEGRKESASKRSAESHTSITQREYSQAWQRYLAAWDELKHELLHAGESADEGGEPSKRIPWPVLGGRAVTRPNIETFMQNIPQGERSRVHILKAERVKWHPDKMQQRFGGKVDEGTMKVVTGVFHVVDAALEEERGKS